MNKNLGRVGKRENGKVIVQFADMVYELKKLFDFQVGSTFEPKMPTIVAMSHEIRAASSRIRKVYGKTGDVSSCLEELDRILYEVERMAMVGPVYEEGKEKCRYRLNSMAYRLAEICMTGYSSSHPDDQGEGRQVSLAGYYVSGCYYKIYGAINC